MTGEDRPGRSGQPREQRVLLGFVSADFFDDVGAWIMSHGRDPVNRISADPDALTTLAEDRHSVESGAAEELSMLV